MKKSIVAILTLCILLTTCLFAIPALAEEGEHTCSFTESEEMSIAATCTEKGFKLGVCECGKVKLLSTIPALGHDFGEDTKWEFDKENKQHTDECSRCGKVAEACEFEIAAESGVTCTKAGKVTYTCITCDGSYEEENATIEHTIVCTPVDEKEQHNVKCSFCNSEELKKDGVACTFEVITDTATCTEGGTKTLKCVCGKEKTEESEARGHSYKYIEKDGKHYAICMVCGATKDEAACEYEYETKDGKHIATCKICGTKGEETACTAEEYKPVEGKQEHKGTCTLCGKEFTVACDIEWSKSEEEGANTHTGKCKICGAAYEATECVFDQYEVSEDGMTHTATCVCGRTKSHAAKFGAWEYDAEENTHTRKCADCERTESHTCTLGAWTHDAVAENEDTAAAAKDTHSALCSVCNTAVTAECSFTYTAYTPDESEAAKQNVVNKELEKMHIATCSVCKYQKEAEKCGDNWEQDKEKSKAATCTEEGVFVYRCKLCKQEIETEYSGTENALGHLKGKEPVEDKEVVKDEKGHTFTYLCTREGCGEEFTETEEHTFAETATPVKGEKKHTVKCTVCGYEKTVDCTEEVMADKAPTCTETGTTGGKQCKYCKQILDEQPTEVPAKGHTKAEDKAVAATCTTNGKKKGTHCSVCNEVLKEGEVIPAYGHDFKFDRTDATCDKKGNYYYKCAKCGEETVVAGLKAPATGKHKFKLVKTVEATAEKNGYKLYQCSACTETKTVEIVYKVNTGASAVLAGAAGVVLMAGAAFLVSRGKKKTDAE